MKREAGTREKDVFRIADCLLAGRVRHGLSGGDRARTD